MSASTQDKPCDACGKVRPLTPGNEAVAAAVLDAYLERITPRTVTPRRAQSVHW
jgi:hypothetical protein